MCEEGGKNWQKVFKHRKYVENALLRCAVSTWPGAVQPLVKKAFFGKVSTAKSFSLLN